MVELLDLRGALNAHHMVESRLLSGKLSLIVVTFGLLSGLFKLLLSLLYLFSFPEGHALLRCESVVLSRAHVLALELDGGVWNARAGRVQLSGLIWGEVGDLIVFTRTHSSNSWSLFLEYRVLHIIFHLGVLDEPLHAITNVVHLEDFGS